MAVDEDLVYVERFQQGDVSAFEFLVRKYQKSVLNLVYRFTGDATRAEDLAQEVFVRVYRALGGFEAKAKFFTYLYKITLNLCLKERERERRKRSYSLEENFNDEEGRTRDIEEPSGSAEDEVERRDTARVVREAVMSLPEEQRTAVILHRYNGLSYEELAEILDISLPAVKSRLHRAKLALKERLEGFMRGDVAPSGPSSNVRKP
jgi:RNA polymerase sigma-70 factor (ECF subfamily)